MNVYYFILENSSYKPSSEELLRRSLFEYNEDNNLGYSRDSLNKERIIKNSKGKPFFSDLKIKFSISHSGNLWICVFSDENVGIDIQEIKNINTKKIAKRYFSEEEYLYIDKNGLNSFFQIWTMKEAFVKYIGEGISYGFGRFSVVKNDKLVKSINKPIACIFERISIYESDKVECYICSSEKGEIWIKQL